MLIDSFHMNVEDTNIWGNIQKAGESIVYVHDVDSDCLAPGMGRFFFR